MFDKLLPVCAAVSALAWTSFGWEAGDLTVDVVQSPMNIKVSADRKTLVEITQFTFGTNNVTSLSNVEESSEKMVLSAGSITITLTSVEGGIHFTSQNPSVPQVIISMKDQGEHFYGITQHNINSGDKCVPDLRGMTVKDVVFEYNQKDEDAETYGGFYFTSLGYAGYFDTFFNGEYTFGSSSKTTVNHKCPTLDWYLFYGPQLSKIQKSFFKVIGAPKKVPMWACGPLVWHDNYTGGQMLVDHAKSFTEIRIPYSNIWLDRPYNTGANGWSNMNFEGNFANPEQWIKELSDNYYVKLVTWIMPGTFDAEGPTGYFSGTPNHYLDLTRQDHVTWYKDKIKTGQYPYGIKGHKMDRVDNGWGDRTDLPAFSDGTPAEERHHKYCYLNAKVTHEMLMENVGEDHFNFPRAAVPRCQQYTCAIWNGDSYANWDGMKTSLGNMVRAGFQGWPMWGSDICGYKQTAMPQIDNYCRWTAFGVYSGFFELMLDGKEPWKLSETDQEKVRELFNLRFELLPYVYSIINRSAELGVSMMPLVGEYPDEEATYKMYDEYLFGPVMLVAPIYSATNSRSVYLPRGKWINVHNYKDVHTGPKTVTSANMSLTQTPVYIKSNSIYPTGQVFAGLAKKWEPDFDSKRNVVINAFPGETGEKNEFTYVDYLDSDKEKVLSIEALQNDVVHVKSPSLTVPGKAIVRLPSAPTTVLMNGAELNSSQYNYNATTLCLEVPFATGTTVDLKINDVVGIIDGFTKPSVCGRLQVHLSGHDLNLIIPPATGMKRNSLIEAIIYDMRGKQLWESSISANRICTGPCKISLTPLSGGSYVAEVKIDGIIAQRNTIVVAQ